MSLASLDHDTSVEISEVTLHFLNKNDVEQVKELCNDWFPIQYPCFWYESITETKFYYALAAFHADVIVGLLVAQTKSVFDINGIDRKLLSTTDMNNGNIGYILTLGTRKQYRRQGIASLLLNQYIEHLRLDYIHKCTSKFKTNKKIKKSPVIKYQNSSNRESNRIILKYCPPSTNTKSNDNEDNLSLGAINNKTLSDLQTTCHYSNDNENKPLTNMNSCCINIENADNNIEVPSDLSCSTSSEVNSSETSPLGNCYVVETSVTCISVLERLQCPESDILAASPVTAIMLHVLTTNLSAINFYSSKKFMRLTHLPKFYLIDNKKTDGYSYVLYINGGKSPNFSTNDSINPLSHLSRPWNFFTDFTQPLMGKASRWLYNKSTSNNLFSFVFGSMTSVVESVILSIVDKTR